MITGLFWLLGLEFKAKLTRLSGNIAASLLFLVYLSIAVGAIYSPEPAEAAKELFTKVPLLAWPFLLSTIPGYKLPKIDLLLRIFILSSVLSCLVAFGYAFWRYSQDANPAYFFFNELLSLTRVSAHYMGMYLSFAYGLVLYRLLDGRPLLKNGVLNVLMLIILSLSIVLVSVRMQYLIFIFINVVMLARLFRKTEDRKKAWSWLVGMLAVFTLLIWLLPGSRQRIIDTYHEIRSAEEMVENKQTNPRKFLWGTGWDLIEDHFWLGTGTGAENKELNRRLQEVDAVFWDGHGTYQLYEMRFNLHNAFLQIFAANGIFAFLLLLALFIWPLSKLKRHPFKVEAALFLGISFLSFLTESMLERQAGLLYFSFFYSLFFVMIIPSSKALGKKIKAESSSK